MFFRSTFIFIPCHNFSPFHHIYYSFSFSFCFCFCFVVRQALFFSSSIVFSEIRETCVSLSCILRSQSLKAADPAFTAAQFHSSLCRILYLKHYYMFCPERRVLTLVLNEKEKTKTATAATIFQTRNH